MPERRFTLDDGPGPARPLSKEQEDALIDGVFARLDANPLDAKQLDAKRLDVKHLDAKRLDVKRRRLTLPLAAAIAASLVSIVAVAGVVGYVALPYWRTANVAPATRSPKPPAPEPPAVTTAPEPPAVTTAPEPPAVTTAPEPPAVTTAPEPPAVPSEPEPPAAASASRASRAAPRNLPRPSSRSSQRPKAAASTPASRDDLAAANRLRAAHRWRAAERAYLKVLREHPGTDEAYAALVAAAALEIEHLSNPRGALALLARAEAERPDGVLAQEVGYSTAEAHRALGDAEGEARALRDFLAAHPDAPMAARARARLEILTRR